MEKTIHRQGAKTEETLCVFAPFHEPSPHPNPLPSHRMGAEREQETDTNCSTDVCRAAAGSWCVRSFFWNRRLCIPRSKGMGLRRILFQLTGRSEERRVGEK